MAVQLASGSVLDPSVDRQIAHANSLLAEAHEQKRLANLHRRRARSSMDRFHAFCRHLEELGIEVIIEDRATDPPGGTSDQDPSARARARAS